MNHSETVYRYPTLLVPTVKMRFEKVRYSRLFVVLLFTYRTLRPHPWLPTTWRHSCLSKIFEDWRSRVTIYQQWPPPLRTHVKDFYTPCFLCTKVVREGSRRFTVVEPFGNSVQVAYTPCYPTLFPSGSTTANLLEPSRTTLVQRKQGVDVSSEWWRPLLVYSDS